MRSLVQSLILLFHLAVYVQAAPTNESKWSLDFLIVDESGMPLPGARIFVAYVDRDNANLITPTNLNRGMVFTNVVTDEKGEARLSEAGAPDGWQCNFQKQGFQKLYKLYSGPSNATGIVGSGPAHQKHTEMLARTNASIWAYPKWTVNLKAVDQAGKAVQDATVTIYYNLHFMSEPTNVVGRTDSNGVFTISKSDPSWDIRVAVEKPNYKAASKGISFGVRDAYDPARWNPTVTLVLEPVNGNGQ